MDFSLNGAGAFLLGYEVSSKYTPMGLTDLQGVVDDAVEMVDGDEAVVKPILDFMASLHEFIGAVDGARINPEFDDENVLTIVAATDEGGVPDGIYGPSVFKNDDGEPVMKLGNNTYRVAIAAEKVGHSLTVGELVGGLTIKQKDDKDELKGVVVTASIRKPKGTSFEVQLLLEKDNTLTKTALVTLLDDGVDNLIDYLAELPKGGEFKKIKELELGEYRLLGLNENKVHEEYGRSWTFDLEGVGKVVSAGRIQNTLPSMCPVWQGALKKGFPFTFAFTSKVPVSQGVQVECSIFRRMPDPAKIPASVTAAQGGRPSAPTAGQIAPSDLQPAAPAAAAAQATVTVPAVAVPAVNSAPGATEAQLEF